jgi:hypothetical protein
MPATGFKHHTDVYESSEFQNARRSCRYQQIACHYTAASRIHHPMRRTQESAIIVNRLRAVANLGTMAEKESALSAMKICALNSEQMTQSSRRRSIRRRCAIIPLRLLPAANADQNW